MNNKFKLGANKFDSFEIDGYTYHLNKEFIFFAEKDKGNEVNFYYCGCYELLCGGWGTTIENAFYDMLKVLDKNYRLIELVDNNGYCDIIKKNIKKVDKKEDNYGKTLKKARDYIDELKKGREELLRGK